MMRTEDDARVSLEDAFTDGTPSPDSSKKGSTKGKVKTKKKKKSKSLAKSPATEFGAVLRWVFGPFFPLMGTVSWESTGTSWVLPDLIFLFWRLISFGVLLGLYLSLSSRELIEPFSNDVYNLSVLASALLLLPPAALLIAGPHEDDLEAAGVRWLWSLVTGALQVAATHVTFMVGLYLIVERHPALIHLTPAGLLLGELAIGCTQPRLSYAFGGALCNALYLGLVKMGRTTGVGVWLATKVLKHGGKMFVAVVAAYLLTGLGLVAVGRARTRLAWWLEQKREGNEDTVQAEIEW